jgi:hypothetical protein
MRRLLAVVVDGEQRHERFDVAVVHSLSKRVDDSRRRGCMIARHPGEFRRPRSRAQPSPLTTTTYRGQRPPLRDKRTGSAGGRRARLVSGLRRQALGRLARRGDLRLPRPLRRAL